MSIVPKHLYSEDMPDNIRFRFAACRDCAARNLGEASKVCRPESCPSGEHTCDGSEGDTFIKTSWDKLGRACRPTNKEMKAEAASFLAYYNEACEMGCDRSRANCACSNETWRKWMENNP